VEYSRPFPFGADISGAEVRAVPDASDRTFDLSNSAEVWRHRGFSHLPLSLPCPVRLGRPWNTGECYCALPMPVGLSEGTGAEERILASTLMAPGISVSRLGPADRWDDEAL
jgi:hypothetical protein